jgi:hypothetical protein
MKTSMLWGTPPRSSRAISSKRLCLTILKPSPMDKKRVRDRWSKGCWPRGTPTKRVVCLVATMSLATTRIQRSNRIMMFTNTNCTLIIFRWRNNYSIKKITLRMVKTIRISIKKKIIILSHSTLTILSRNRIYKVHKTPNIKMLLNLQKHRYKEKCNAKMKRILTFIRDTCQQAFRMRHHNHRC